MLDKKINLKKFFWPENGIYLPHILTVFCRFFLSLFKIAESVAITAFDRPGQRDL